MKYSIEISSLEELDFLTKKIANYIKPNLFIGLSGELGSGKTTFVQGVLRNLGIKDKIKSPSYTILEQYSIENYKIFHFDLYRFKNSCEWIDNGFDEVLLNDLNITLIEWIERAADVIEKIDLNIIIVNENNKRKFEFLSSTIEGENFLNNLFIL